MILDKKDVNRLVIYFFYDADGIVDRYVPYILEDMKRNSSEVFVVVNGKLTPEGRKTFEKITPKVFVRENVGFDVWAYKESMGQYGWEKLSEFDEVVLMNYTIFGPLYPFSEMFEEMNKRDLDFWGITKHHKVDFDVFGTCKYKYIPEHIQSSFLVIRRSLMESAEYHNLWDRMPMINSYAESVGLYEAIFTKDFTEKGFKSDVYIDTSDLEGYTRYPLMMMSNELIINRKCPIIKLKSFSQNYSDILVDTIGNCTIDSFEFIKNHLDYNVDMIWEHTLRVSNIADIKNIMHLNCILPADHVKVQPETPANRVALVMHLYYDDLVEKSFKYASSMPDGCDLYVTVTNDKMAGLVSKEAEKHKQFNKTEIIKIENKGRDVSALLVGFAPYVNNYDLVCFVHDKKTLQVKPYCLGESFAYKCFDNNLASKEYVKNIIRKFEDNPRLGMLMPPPPNHGNYYNFLHMGGWSSNYENTKKLAEKLNLHCPISQDKEIIAPLGTMFWFRPEALTTLFDYNWKFDDFPKEPVDYDGTLLHAIERVYGLVVQHEGYYSEWVLTEKNASIELTNLNYFLINSLKYQNFLLGSSAASPKKIKFKRKVKKIIPPFLWNFFKKIYHKLGGRKWVG